MCVLFQRSSTTSANDIGLAVCFHRPGTSLLWKYPCLLRRCSSSLFARSPAWGSQYIPFVTLIQTMPCLLAIFCSLYSLMISSGMSSIFTRIYSGSGRLSGVMR